MSIDTVFRDNFDAIECNFPEMGSYNTNGLSMRRFGVGRYAMGIVAAAVGTTGDDDSEKTGDVDESDKFDQVDTSASASVNMACATGAIGACSSLVAFNPTDQFYISNYGVGSIDAFYELLASGYDKDSAMFVRNIMSLGSGTGCWGKNYGPYKNHAAYKNHTAYKNHAAYMVGLVWTWKLHPTTFIESMAPHIGDNSSYQDLLTLLSVITFNRSFPIEGFWCGEQPGVSMEARRAGLRAKESMIWKNLLVCFGVASKDVVRTGTLRKASRTRSYKRHAAYGMTLQRDTTATAYVSPYGSSCTTPVTPASGDNTVYPFTSAVTKSRENPPYVFGSVCTTATNCRSTTNGNKNISNGNKNISNGNKNIWLNDAFKQQWQTERAKLHRQHYGSPVGVPGTVQDYELLTDFIVSSFAAGITAENPMVAKWAPMPGGLYDNSTKRVHAFKGNNDSKLPTSWGTSGGVSQAVAYKLYGALLKQRMVQDATAGTAVFSIDAQKMFVTTLYKDTVSRICANSI
ncbi:hypothetical protein T484DRAFT_1755095 [Baffinella frigidus]|nr:hypothetical protein T484DRAFT_1755095 [Cryptophyta sp. CCMP2293]